MSCPKAENAKSCEIRFKRNISASEAELHVTLHQIVLFEPRDGIFKETAPHLAKIIKNVSRIARTTPIVLKYFIRLYYLSREEIEKNYTTRTICHKTALLPKQTKQKYVFMFYFYCNSPNCVGLLILKSFFDLIFSFSFVDLFFSLFGPNTFILLVFKFGQRRNPTPGIYSSLKKKTPFPLYLYISQCLFEKHRKNWEYCPGHSLTFSHQPSMS